MAARVDRTASFLLRVWPTKRGGRVIWLALLQNARTGERLAFRSLADCLDYLGQTFAADEPGEVPKETTQGGE